MAIQQHNCRRELAYIRSVWQPYAAIIGQHVAYRLLLTRDDIALFVRWQELKVYRNRSWHT